jgi:hypothetical protein
VRRTAADKRSAITTTHDEIVDHWSRRQDECGLAIDWSEALERCWRCAYPAALERCHIVPDALGGNSAAGNLVLLCGRCHREAPNHDNPKYMWTWLRATCVPFYDTYWTVRGWNEFELMFGRPPLLWLDAANIDRHAVHEAFQEMLAGEIERATLHFGEGRLNPSTIACIMMEAETKLADQFGLTPPAGEAVSTLDRLVRSGLSMRGAPESAVP